VDKYRSNDMQSNYDPETASVVWTAPNYYTAQAKATMTLTPRLLVEGGWSGNIEYRNTVPQEGIAAEAFTPEWYARATRTLNGSALGYRTTSPLTYGSQWPSRQNLQASASYVTGSHHAKVGFQYQYGRFFHRVVTNGDIEQQYANYNEATQTFSNPVAVIARNTPRISQESLNADLGIYAQDSWTIRRLTLNLGIRWEYLNSQVDETTAPAGRFVPARTAPEITDLPSWKDWAPRFQVAYDLFGNAKTALKFSLNRYNIAEATSIAAGFNPLSTAQATLAWTDKNGDLIAQGGRTWNAAGTAYTDCDFANDAACEINLANLSPNFGLLSAAGTYGGYPRTWNLERSVEVQHELLAGLSVSAGWTRGSLRNLTTTINRNLEFGGDPTQNPNYTPIQIVDPRNGEPITVYARNAASVVTDSFTFVDDSRKSVYNSYNTEFRYRIGRGGTLFGGLVWERELENTCSSAVDNPNALRFCDDNALDLPYATNFRLAGSYPLTWGIMVSGVLQSNDGGAQALSYSLVRNSTRYPTGSNPKFPATPNVAGQIVLPSTFNPATLTVALEPTGRLRNERLTQLDLRASKTFRVGRTSIIPQIEAFNITNTDMVITYGSTAYGNQAYLTPNSTVQGRVIGVGAQVRW
jgi:hypothetical protein